MKQLMIQNFVSQISWVCTLCQHAPHKWWKPRAAFSLTFTQNKFPLYTSTCCLCLGLFDISWLNTSMVARGQTNGCLSAGSRPKPANSVLISCISTLKTKISISFYVYLVLKYFTPTYFSINSYSLPHYSLRIYCSRHKQSCNYITLDSTMKISNNAAFEMCRWIFPELWASAIPAKHESKFRLIFSVCITAFGILQKSKAII